MNKNKISDNWFKIIKQLTDKEYIDIVNFLNTPHAVLSDRLEDKLIKLIKRYK